MSEISVKVILEAALLAAGRPLNLDHLVALFDEEQAPEKAVLREALEDLGRDYEDRGLELKEVASGWRIQVRQTLVPWVSRLWEEKAPRYTRAFLETLAIIAYRQPITRGEIEDIRGVSVSTNIMKALMEREWVRIVGHRDVPGRPAMYGTTREFMDYFNLKSLDELPTLAELRDIDSINAQLDLNDPGAGAAGAGDPAAIDVTAAPDDSDIVAHIPLRVDEAAGSDEPENMAADDEDETDASSSSTILH